MIKANKNNYQSSSSNGVQNFQEGWLMPMLMFIPVVFVIYMLQNFMLKSVFRKPKKISSREEPELLEELETELIYEDEVENENTPDQLKVIRERHDESKKTIAMYSMDTMLALQYPVFNDVTDKTTSAMLKALDYAGDMYSIAQMDLTTETIKDYSEAVTDLTHKTSLAQQNAEQVQWDKLDVQMRKYFTTAESLYTHAFDPGNPDELRISYMNRLKEVIEKINRYSKRNTIPEDILLTIEKSKQLELTE